MSVCEAQEVKLADGEDIDIVKFQTVSNSLRRLCESIGLKRVVSEKTLDLKHYLEATAQPTQAKKDGSDADG